MLRFTDKGLLGDDIRGDFDGDFEGDLMGSSGLTLRSSKGNEAGDDRPVPGEKTFGDLGEVGDLGETGADMFLILSNVSFTNPSVSGTESLQSKRVH